MTILCTEHDRDGEGDDAELEDEEEGDERLDVRFDRGFVSGRSSHGEAGV